MVPRSEQVKETLNHPEGHEAKELLSTFNNYAMVEAKCDSLRKIFSKPQEILVLGDQSKIGNLRLQKELRTHIKFLFSYIERLAAQNDNLDPPFEALGLLSGLSEIFTGDANESNDLGSPVDAETIWGQVDLQNDGLIKLLKNQTKELVKSVKKYEKSKDPYHLVRLVDLDGISSHEDEPDKDQINKDDNIEESQPDSDSSESNSHDEHSSIDDSDLDDDAKRIRERMERVMAGIEDEEEDDEDRHESAAESGRKYNNEAGHKEEESESSLIDPAAENLNDGFFDLHEMESFADEEEEYHMPADDEEVDERQHSKLALKKNIITGDLNHDDDSENEFDDEDTATEEVFAFKRKKYREDDEIDALLGIYDSPKDEEAHYDDIINMTAADFFGNPNKKYLNKSSRNNRNKLELNKSSSNEKQRQNKIPTNSHHNSSGDQSIGDNEDAYWSRERDDEDSDAGDVNGEVHLDMKLGDYKTGATASKKKSNLLADQMRQIEEEMLAEKPWQMKGETIASNRPVNSLLEATPQFEITAKVAPIITQEFTQSIEETIRKRILDEDWDDVMPRELPNITKKSVLDEPTEVSQERSKLSLGELYEREYLKKIKGYDVDAAEANDKEKAIENEIKSTFASLMSQLDALSKYHYAPRPIEEEIEVRNVSVPAIAMEEVLPLHMSDSRVVAPEEVYRANKGRASVLKGDSELHQDERKRIRSAKKSARRKDRKAKQADERLISRLTPNLGLNNPYEKRKLREELSRARSKGKVVQGATEDRVDYKTSALFFKRMHDDVQKTIGQDSKKPRLEQATSENKKSSSFKL